MRDRVAIRPEHLPRCRAIVSACAVVASLCGGCETSFDDDPRVTHSQRLSLDDRQPQVITQELAAGAWLIEAREHDIELRLVVDAAGQRTEMDDAVPRHGLLATVVALPSPARVRIELRSTDHRSKRGSADLRIGQWRTRDTGPASERQLAYAAFGEAGAQTAVATKESWTQAVERLHEAATHFANAGDRAGVAQAQYTLGHLQYLQLDDRPAAIRAADEAAVAFREIGDQTGEQRAAVLRAASELELASGMNASTQRAEQRAMYDAADRRLADAAQYFTRRQLMVSAAYAVNMRGVRAIYFGDQDKAAEYFSQAVAMARANGDAAEELKSLANLAWVHYSTGHIAEAAEEYGQLLPLIERDRQANLYATILSNRGFCLIALGDFDRALSLHTEALDMYRAQGQELEQSRQLLALGNLYLRTGDLQRSLDTLRSAIDVQTRIGDAIGQATALRSAGAASSALGQHDLALDYLRRSAQIDVNTRTVGRTRVLIASELRVLGNLKAAEAELAQALQSANLQVRAEALDERGRLRVSQRRLTDAIKDLRAADQQFAALGLDFNRIDTNATLSQSLLGAGDTQGAIAAADEAIALVGRIRVKSANPEWRARFLSMRYLPYEARIAAELASAPPGDQAAAWRAFRIAEEVRARSLTDLLVRDTSRRDTGEDSREAALRAQLTAQQLRLEARLQDPDASDRGTQELRRAIIETRARIDALRAEASGVAATEVHLTRSLDELQARLPADTAVLAYFVGDSATHAWLITREALRHTSLGGRTEMARFTDAMVEAQRQPRGMAPTAEMGRKLVGGLFEGIQSKRLLLVPDGPLNGLPFAALPLPEGNGQLMIDRFVLGYSPSIALALRTTPRRSARPPRVAVISDPVYAPDDRRLASAGGGNLRSRPPAPYNKLTRLPFSGLEARAVIKALGVSAPTELNGFDANARRVLQLGASAWSVLHFATHASARPDSPEQSALFLSEYRPDGSQLNDSRFSVAEIMRSGLKADIVVLSGCETGDGGRLRGEGVLGLTYGFLANGSGSVVAALWPIEDSTTARFMSEFYDAYQASGRAADALRIAQLRARESGNAALWASFVVRANEFP